ncbi:hypothetical protein O9993_00200 [Vibrio lentus]|nr:hypothetical protein [Vibrio lentus]
MTRLLWLNETEPAAHRPIGEYRDGQTRNQRPQSCLARAWGCMSRTTTTILTRAYTRGYALMENFPRSQDHRN